MARSLLFAAVIILGFISVRQDETLIYIAFYMQLCNMQVSEARFISSYNYYRNLQCYYRYYRCPSPSVFNWAVCSCQRNDTASNDNCNETCPASYTQNSNCECECDRVCPAAFELDPDECRCACNRTCPENYKLSPYRCQCYCNRRCPKNYWLNRRDCSCSCNRRCPSHYTLDSDTCQCVCNRTCPENYKLDSNSCKCVCDRDCPENYKLDRYRCQCINNTNTCCNAYHRSNQHRCRQYGRSFCALRYWQGYCFWRCQVLLTKKNSLLQSAYVHYCIT